MTPPDPVAAPFGSWDSPVSAASLTADSVTLMEPRLDGSDVCWLEGRPRDGGRVVVVRRTAAGDTSDVTAAPYNVRSRVHEYGGGAYDVAGGVLAFCNFEDRRVYVVDLAKGGEPRPITPAGDLRYGDLRVSTRDGVPHSLLAVCEDHTDHGDGAQASNRLVRLSLTGDNADGGVVLAEGHDFVSSAVESLNGTTLAWVRWDHPNMPWDASELCVADIDPGGGGVGEVRVVAGGADESVLQPQWAPDGRLVFLSDRTGFWNLYVTDVAATTATVTSATSGPPDAVALWPDDHDFTGPQWSLGMSPYGISASGTILCTRLVDGYSRLGTVCLTTCERADVASDAVVVGALVVRGETALMTVGYSGKPAELVRLDLPAVGAPDVVRRSAASTLDAAFVSTSEPVTWDAPDSSQVHGFFLAPRNPAYCGVDGELPPLIVLSHGGPTGMTTPQFSADIQYWTTRGFAVLQVNYGGSSGYGRAYRERLRGRWGIVDVDDCAAGAVAMAEFGWVDRARLAIRGGSAGGYTTLAALAFRDVFSAGSSWFGVADLEGLARDTHKFESHYLDGLIGPYPAARSTYLERSPIHHVDQISCPVILLQGREDRVVPLTQAEEMASAMRARGLPVALIVFDGEGHGFRRSENIITAFEAEVSFFGQVFGFQPADDVDPVDIDNSSASR